MRESWMKSISEKDCTFPICMRMVEKYSNSLVWIPKKFRNQDICMVSMANGGDLRDVPEQYMNTELITLAVKNKAWNIASVINTKYLTYELCLMAVKSKAETIRFIPQVMVTTEMIARVAKHHPYSLMTVELDEALSLAVIQANPKAIIYVPHKYKNDISK